MHPIRRDLRSSYLALCCLTAAIAAGVTCAADFGPGFKTQAVAVDGGVVSVTVGGSGPPVVLIHGYAETSRMWKPLAKVLAPRFTVIAPDLPGIGDSSIPKERHRHEDLGRARPRRRALARILEGARRRTRHRAHGRVCLRRDVSSGSREARAHGCIPSRASGAGKPSTTIPGSGTSASMVRRRRRWRRVANASTSSDLWNNFAADKNRSIPEADRRAYTQSYARPGRMAAGFAYFASFPKTATDFAELSKTKLAIPVLSLGGEKSLGDVLGAQTKLVASDVTVVVLKDTGHWMLEERPDETIAALTRFLQ